MKEETKNILLGMGSLVDIIPSNGLKRAVARQHARHDVAFHFSCAGAALKDACDKFGSDVEVTASKK